MSLRKRLKPLRRSLLTQGRQSKLSSRGPELLNQGVLVRLSLSASVGYKGFRGTRQAVPQKFCSGVLNLGEHFCYQIDTVFSLQTGAYKIFLTQDRRGAPAIFALLGVVARPAGLVLIATGPRVRGQRTVFRRVRKNTT